MKVFGLNLLATGVSRDGGGGVAAVDDEVGHNVVEDADGFREGFLGEFGGWEGVSVGVEEVLD